MLSAPDNYLVVYLAVCTAKAFPLPFVFIQEARHHKAMFLNGSWECSNKSGKPELLNTVSHTYFTTKKRQDTHFPLFFGHGGMFLTLYKKHFQHYFGALCTYGGLCSTVK